MRLSDADFKRRVVEMLTGLTADVADLKNDVAGLKTDVAGLKTDVAGLKLAVAGLETDVAALKTAVTGLETEVSGLKGDVLSLKAQVAGLDLRVSRLEHETLKHFARLTGDVRELRERLDAHDALTTLQVTHFDAHMQDITSAIGDLTTLHTSSTSKILTKLEDHERRISALERGGGR